jgi:hypothetical protein
MRTEDAGGHLDPSRFPHLQRKKVTTYDSGKSNFACLSNGVP